jgi:hypothetical protein
LLAELRALSRVLQGMNGYDRTESSLLDRIRRSQSQHLGMASQVLANYDARVSGKIDPE